jgi:hypothetical protein
VVAHKERLEEERYLILQQLNDANEREKRNMQLIQDLEQEIRHNVKARPDADLSSIERSSASMAAFADRVALNRISDQMGSQFDSPESSSQKR